MYARYVKIKEPYGKVKEAILRLKRLQELIALTSKARDELAEIEGVAINELADMTKGGVLADVYIVRIDGKWYAVDTDADAGELLAIEEVFEAPGA